MHGLRVFEACAAASRVRYLQQHESEPLSEPLVNFVESCLLNIYLFLFDFLPLLAAGGSAAVFWYLRSACKVLLAAPPQGNP